MWLDGIGNALIGLSALLTALLGYREIKHRKFRRKTNGKMNGMAEIVSSALRMAEVWEADAMQCRKRAEELESRLWYVNELEQEIAHLRRRRGGGSRSATS